MAQLIITDSLLTDIADEIRNKNGTNDTYTPSEMATAISNINVDESISGAITFNTTSVSENIPANTFIEWEGTKAKISTTKIDGMTKDALTTSVAGDVWCIKEPGSLTYTVTKPAGTYQFNLNSSTGYYTSNNNGVNSSYALAKVEFVNTFSETKTITITFINYAEGSCDFGIFSNLDNTLTSSNSADSGSTVKLSCNSGTYNKSTEQTLTYDIPNGTHFIYIKYRKDGSVHSYNDSLQFKISY